MEEKKICIYEFHPNYSHAFTNWMERLHRIWEENKCFGEDEPINIELRFTEYVIACKVFVNTDEQKKVLAEEWEKF